MLYWRLPHLRCPKGSRTQLVADTICKHSAPRGPMEKKKMASLDWFRLAQRSPDPFPVCFRRAKRHKLLRSERAE